MNIWSMTAYHQITNAIKFVEEGNCEKIEITEKNHPGQTIKIYKVKNIIRIDIKTA